jgi:hypothetical protein
VVKPLVPGDYVFATKYSDGDPLDGYAIGYFDSMLDKGPTDQRFMVVDSAGKQFRFNGFRRCERVSEELGHWLVLWRPAFEKLSAIEPINVWGFRRKTARTALERWATDEGKEFVAEWRERYFNVRP